MTDGKVRRTLYGGCSANTVGYCAFHERAITEKQLHRHQCLGKQCSALVRCEDHPFWEKREERRAKRKERQAHYEAMYAQVKGGDRPAL